MWAPMWVTVFLVVFVGVAALLLTRELLRRIRRLDALERELAAAKAAPPAPTPAPSTSPGVGARAPANLCSGCVFFDLEEGQAVMAQHPRFMEAALHLAPSEMGRQVDPETQEVIARDIPAKVRWDEFGACTLRREVLWGGQDGTRRLRVLPPFEFVPGRMSRSGLDCWSDDPAIREGVEKTRAEMTAAAAAEEETTPS